MTARLIDGVALSAQLRSSLKQRANALTAQGREPGLAVILVGENPASRIYVRNKIKACAETGIRSEIYEFPTDASQEQVLDRIRALNADPGVHGILVQLPLPRQVDEAKVLETLSVEKDVDGFHVQNIGSLVVGKPGFAPCTPAGCMAMLDHIDVPIEGREAVVIGRSNIVGKPMALMLLQRSATVTICTSRTIDLARHSRRADILVVATGKPRMVSADMIKPGAAVIDVGVNRVPFDDPVTAAAGRTKVVGDVHFKEASQVAGWITPVPGGVGLMTVACLLRNTVTAARRQAGL
jgi:methylenetetrahydrofolate dehydrogenase (NADP+)/methenyltetrahydrofolate cyclohydrolase